MKDSAMFKIDKKIPIPADRVRYPMYMMQVGDSVFMPGCANTPGGKLRYVNPYTAGTKAIPGSKWVTRTATEDGVEGVRVWRLA